jgi:hypothetical protein
MGVVVGSIGMQNSNPAWPIRREEDLVSIARYIVANPLRAGIVKSVREYPHWDAVWF